ncbi:MAG: phage portal protein [Epsilonproteobacteria bacterium]|nr:phage portal protein [Campylobacterota bacterium]
MSLLGRFTSLFRKRRKRAFYEGGRITKANRDFWNANSPFETTASPDRDILRARARWLHENNPIMANIDKTIVNNVVGRGIKLQSKTGKRRVDDEIERLWHEWEKSGNCDITGRLNFGDLQRLILEQRMVDGEIFIYKRLTKDKNFPLKIQLIEADRINKFRTDWNVIDGIEIDKNGRPVKIHIVNQIDYDAKIEYIELKAEDVINYFRAERATQYRGVSEYKQAILDLKNFMAFQTATIQAARARANIAYVVEQDEAPGFHNRVYEDEDFELIQEINGVMVHYLRKGQKINKLDPDLVDRTYGDFVKTVIRMLAVARNVSYELAFRDFSEVNYSSARAAIIQDNKRFDYEQQHLIAYFLNPLFEAWMDAMVMAGRIKSINPVAYFKDKSAYVRPKWITPAREWVDPIKDMKAIETELALGLTTKSEVIASRGKDYEEVLLQQKREKELEKQILGVENEKEV